MARICFNIEATDVREFHDTLRRLLAGDVPFVRPVLSPEMEAERKSDEAFLSGEVWTLDEQEEIMQEREPVSEDAELDAHGHPWSAGLHASTKGKTQDGLWRMGRGKERPAPMPGYPKTGTSPEPALDPDDNPPSDEVPTPATDEEDEFAAFRTAAVEEVAAEPEVKAREWSDADLSKIANWAANRLGSPAGVMTARDKYIPAGNVAKTSNIPVEDRERFAQELEELTGAKYEG